MASGGGLTVPNSYALNLLEFRSPSMLVSSSTDGLTQLDAMLRTVMESLGGATGGDSETLTRLAEQQGIDLDPLLRGEFSWGGVTYRLRLAKSDHGMLRRHRQDVDAFLVRQRWSGSAVEAMDLITVITELVDQSCTPTRPRPASDVASADPDRSMPLRGLPFPMLALVFGVLCGQLDRQRRQERETRAEVRAEVRAAS